MIIFKKISQVITQMFMPVNDDRWVFTHYGLEKPVRQVYGKNYLFIAYIK